MNKQHIALRIHGLSCGGGGALQVEQAVRRVPGVLQVYVNPLLERAYVDCDGVPHLQAIVEAVHRAGYRAGAPAGHERPQAEPLPYR